MKLEKKHVLRYCPDLKIQWQDTKEINSIVIEPHRVFKKGEYGLMPILGAIERKPNKVPFKLVLRPWTDLIKKITHKGETIIPIFELFKLCDETDYIDHEDCDRLTSLASDDCEYSNDDNLYYYLTINRRLENHFEFSYCIAENSFAIHFSQEYSCVSNQMLMFDKLFEWGFDVYNLEMEGFAIFTS